MSRMIPCARPAVAFGFLLAAFTADAPAQNAAASGNGDFNAFLTELWPDAKAQGITRATFDAAFAGLTPDPRVLAATKRQPEYGKPVGKYVNDIVSPGQIAGGKRKLAEWADTLAAVEKKFRVERAVLVAIWGMETSYGALKDKWDVYRSLATLAQARYRHPYFRNELLVTLRIMQDGHIPRDKMVSSWAGAMGQTQFMPSNFMDYAIDFDGDGRRDIWTNVPDVLGSTGNYLAKEKWKFGLPWGFEVLVPPGFDYRKSRASFPEWAKLDVKRADEAAFPPSGDGILFFPSGAGGPAFIATANYPVLKEYNNSDAYVIAVGHLADRLRGGPPIRTAWPKEDPQLPRDQRIALQRRLAELGYDVKKFEGHIDFDIRDHIRQEQVKYGILPDGHPTAGLLERMGVKTR
jgi:membrane-bound lytic murein transglycosylase B